jgi:hypothetical protein
MELRQYILQGRATLTFCYCSLKHLVPAGTLWPLLKLSVPDFFIQYCTKAPTFAPYPLLHIHIPTVPWQLQVLLLSESGT